ncbi:MAG: type II 3-dehydroquinate dehydratase [Alphaproteobacteria bacterium]|nr:type II 3-dehydroquinate dehydratase [Alphaproteobacteria bacterium]NCQ88355.1 type II 3-dehydroquinate dehydratase [Alphaproteobacteria bacterium]NCT05898.1 type II 3-dehydroquinate dehydratase [Alphaproteobacteria bacterium]
MADILILNGPNLNMLGVREPEIYGSESLEDIKSRCTKKAQSLAMTIEFKQSNHEGELVEWIQKALGHIKGIIINAAAYTHTSVAIHDALKLHNIPIIEVHLSDPMTREEFRHFSYIEPLAAHVIKGRGASGYSEALEIMKNEISQ